MRRESVRDGVKELILGALKIDYISESCQDAIKTGNHYQSLVLGDSTTEGFRSERAEFLDRIDFRGKKVLDLGSNLGEMSRGARARGARLVDGFEYDPYFVEIADLVNVHNELDRVSFYRRDITDPSIYGERYDLVLVMSVFIYAGKVIDRLAEITDVLVVETHKLRGNLEETYIDPIGEYFPHYEVLGETEWGTPHDPQEVRAVLVFAKSEELLRSTLLDPPPEGSREHKGGPRETFSAEIDMERTRLHERFFERFAADTSVDLLSAVAGHPLDLSELIASDEARRGYNGWVYWFVFLRGYLEYRETGAVSVENVYLRYLRRFFGPQGYDPSFSRVLEDDAEAITAVTRRFIDLAYREGLEDPRVSGYAPAPIQLILSDPPRAKRPTLFTVSGEELSPRQLDGWHRLFAARLFGAATLPSEVVRADARPGEVLAVVERFSLERDRIELSGWCLSSDVPLHNAQLTAAGRRIANTELHAREDVAASFPDIPHARQSGFGFSGEIHGTTSEPIELTLTVMEDWLPVGAIELPYRPGLFDDEPPRIGPPGRLDREDPAIVAIRSARSAEAVASRLRQHLDLTAVATALVWGDGAAALRFVLSGDLGGALMTTIDSDRPPELEPGDDGFELVIGTSMLSRLDRDGQHAWLGELHRLTRADAYLALTFQGELVRRFLPRGASRRLARDGIGKWPDGPRGWSPPGRTVQTRDYTIGLCSEWFEVVHYAQGVAADIEDLVLLKKSP